MCTCAFSKCTFEVGKLKNASIQVEWLKSNLSSLLTSIQHTKDYRDSLLTFATYGNIKKRARRGQEEGNS